MRRVRFEGRCHQLPNDSVRQRHRLRLDRLEPKPLEGGQQMRTLLTTVVIAVVALTAVSAGGLLCWTMRLTVLIILQPFPAASLQPTA